LPRFFGGRLAAFREIFQNAYRAGAKNVRLTLEGQTLTVEDDGQGCPDPALLLAAGETGWDEARVVEPAGLGFFSLLSKDVSASVTVESRGWRLALVPSQVLARKPVLVTTGSVTQGLRLVLLLVEPRPERDLEEARAYYPFTVTLNGEEVPRRELEGPRIETPVGSVVLTPRSFHHDDFAVWEHRPIRGGGTFARSLQKAAHGRVQEGVLRSFALAWVAIMGCGVVPKLPDRNDLQQGPELDAAASAILASIETHYLALARQVVAKWPDVIRGHYALGTEHEVPDWLVNTHMGTAILEEFGWAVITAYRWSDPNIYFDESDGWRSEPSATKVLTKTFVRVKETSVAHSMNTAAVMGLNVPWAVQDDHGLELKVVGRKGPETSWVRLARHLRVGIYELPFLLDTDKDDHARVLVNGKADEAVRALGRGKATLGGMAADYGDTLVGFIACHDDESLNNSWGEYRGSESIVDWREVRHDVIQQVTHDHLPKALAKARMTHHALLLARDDLDDLATRAQRLSTTLAFRGDEDLKSAQERMRRCQRRLEKKLEQAATRARLPT
jgi:hypothetical protein